MSNDESKNISKKIFKELENASDSNEEIKILDELKSNQIDIYKTIENIRKNKYLPRNFIYNAKEQC